MIRKIKVSKQLSHPVYLRGEKVHFITRITESTNHLQHERGVLVGT